MGGISRANHLLAGFGGLIQFDLDAPPGRVALPHLGILVMRQVDALLAHSAGVDAHVVRPTLPARPATRMLPHDEARTRLVVFRPPLVILS